MLSLTWRTAACMARGELSLLTAEPTPTPAAPEARARGAVTWEMPEAAMVGILTADEIAATRGFRV